MQVIEHWKILILRTGSKLKNILRFNQDLNFVKRACISNTRDRVEEKNAGLMESLGLHSIRGRDRERERE